MRNRRAVASLMATGVLVVGCTPTPPPSPSPVATYSSQPGVAVDRPSYPVPTVTPRGFTAAPAGIGLSGYLSQGVSWRACADGSTTECATVRAPLDYADPERQAITLALKRKKAMVEPRVGTLFVNPGGPGAPGTDLVDYFDRTGLEQYDIVGWDTRGSGGSTPIRCQTAPETDAFLDLDSSPDTEEEWVAYLDGTRAYTRSCWEQNGEILEHVSSIDIARDLDLLRALVGDATLTFLGYSYGTRLGATYAELFPDKVGSLVLDAAVGLSDDEEMAQSEGFERAFGHYADWCAEQRCELGSSREAVVAAVGALLSGLDSAPLGVGKRRLTQSLAAVGVAAYLYGGEDSWRQLTPALRRAQQGDGSALLSAADAMNSRRKDGQYATMQYAGPATLCLDYRDQGVLQARRDWERDSQEAPLFGTYFGPFLTCALWPVRPTPNLNIQAVGAKPILVIGGTGDPATPYEDAVRMAEQLESGVLLTFDGEGHGAYGGNSECVDKVVVDYLVNGRLPLAGTRCS